MINANSQNGFTSNGLRKLIRRHFFQIVQEPRPAELAKAMAITFRPNRQTGSFHDGLLRRAGSTVMIVLSYEPHPRKPCQLMMPIRGLRGQASPDGSVHYGAGETCLFHHDGRLTPGKRFGWGRINALRNPGLLELLLKLDSACKRQLNRLDALPSVPKVPRVLLGFPPDSPPSFEDSPLLRQIAAEQLRVPLDRLGANGPVLLDRLLRDTWESQLVPPSALHNSTGLLMVDAKLCTEARRALGTYEDFSEMLGMPTWNPARGIQFLELENPARHVLRKFDIDVSQSFNQYFSDELIDRLEQAMREAIGVSHVRFTLEEILDGLTNPGVPLVAYSNSLPRLRARLSASVSECCTDDDLTRAARDPSKPLLVSGACSIQVLLKDSLNAPYTPRKCCRSNGSPS